MQVIPATERIFAESSAVLEERPCISMRIKLKRWRHLNFETSLLLYPLAYFEFSYWEALADLCDGHMSSIFVKTGVLSRVSPIRISHKHPRAVGRQLRNRVVRLSGDDAVLSSSVDHEPGTQRACSVGWWYFTCLKYLVGVQDFVTEEL